MQIWSGKPGNYILICFLLLGDFLEILLKFFLQLDGNLKKVEKTYFIKAFSMLKINKD